MTRVTSDVDVLNDMFTVRGFGDDLGTFFKLLA